MQDLEYLNLAINNITKVQNLQRCESLQRLDLTINFIPKAGLLSLCSLAANYNLRDLYLIGNPCTDWPGYRQYVVAHLPQLAKLVRSSTALAAGHTATTGQAPTVLVCVDKAAATGVAFCQRQATAAAGSAMILVRKLC
jgi:protein TilB